MALSLTAKLKLYPTKEQQQFLLQTLHAAKEALNFVSRVAHANRHPSAVNLQKMVYDELRSTYGMRSQMACSLCRVVSGTYKSMQANGEKESLATFKKPKLPLVYNRDYSLKSDGRLSINTLWGRIKVPYEQKAMEHFLDGTWTLGTAALVYKKRNFYFHVAVSKEIEEVPRSEIKNVVGVDIGINFLVTVTGSNDRMLFIDGRSMKNKKAQYKRIRKQLQQKQTPSARRRLKAIGNRENRWQTDVNHRVSKALVRFAGENSLIVLEDLTGIRSTTEQVKRKDRYYTVSWAFHQLRTFIEYKAKMNNCQVIAVDPKHTSQKCPKCGHTEKANRNKKNHTFCCRSCRYSSNDDRIGAMNLRQKGIEYRHGVSIGA